MAKVTAPFLLKGTINDINFVITADGENYARMKGKTGVTSHEFKNNPVFDRIRNQGQEFGHCVKKASQFRQLAGRFNILAKDGSVAGRTNKLLFEILQEDITQPQGKRTLIEGLKTREGKQCLLRFESNKLRPLDKVLKMEEQYNLENKTVTLTDLIAKKHLDWPEEATHVHLSSATANWDFENDSFDSCYSDEIILTKESEKQTLILQTNKPMGNHLYLIFLFIGFAKQERKKYKMLHRKNNTTTIIACYTP
ncbi:hypothetical protein [Flavobacterium frigoris]|uniref:Uncharacterized protein n=1 Tax=Flavobacterium frigoris (strain PS1) TaxID=1086011 RepID=H7FWN2_FLAFP|nr:hypothetical protein [Flavobacterium frigoris]EIA07093.1 hypothetical protein HJ01_03576 [Flavobacterium frigoris PS1]